MIGIATPLAGGFLLLMPVLVPSVYANPIPRSAHTVRVRVKIAAGAFRYSGTLSHRETAPKSDNYACEYARRTTNHYYVNFNTVALVDELNGDYSATVFSLSIDNYTPGTSKYTSSEQVRIDFDVRRHAYSGDAITAPKMTLDVRIGRGGTTGTLRATHVPPATGKGPSADIIAGWSCSQLLRTGSL